jgi:hypothetical protein
MEAKLSSDERFGVSEDNILNTKSLIAASYQTLGRFDESIELRRHIYSRAVALNVDPPTRYGHAVNLSQSLVEGGHYKEGKSFLRKVLPAARRSLGEEDQVYMSLRGNFATALRADGVFSRDDLAEAVTIFEDLFRVMRRVYGAKHPHTERMLRNLAKARRKHTLLVNLRFAVGDRVKCQCGEWVPGRVVRLLYDGPEIENPGWDYAPYQVKLDDGRLVYAPSDDDETIREFNFNPYSK